MQIIHLIWSLTLLCVMIIGGAIVVDTVDESEVIEKKSKTKSNEREKEDNIYIKIQNILKKEPRSSHFLPVCQMSFEEYNNTNTNVKGGSKPIPIPYNKEKKDFTPYFN